MRAFLASLGLDPARYDLADGSGRAHTNRTSAAAYGEFLAGSRDALEPLRGVQADDGRVGRGDGTLRHRLQTEATRGKVFAKTGNVAGVSTLCGYVTAKSGQTYVFSILLNGGCTEGRGHAFQDRFLQELATRG